ncbi:MAG: GH3 auxin-responsive promoter family protein [Phycisphaerales bacterium JB058]
MIEAGSPSTWTSLVGAALEARLALRAPSLEDTEFWRRHTAFIQLTQLRRLFKKAARTEFGRAHGFARMAKLGDLDMLREYRRDVPIVDYEGYRGLIERMREGGEPDILWPGLVRDFAQTSGTTSGDKFMPVSKELFKSNYRASLDIFATLMSWGVSLPTMMSGKCLFLGGSTDLSINEHGIRTGDLSGLVTPLIRWPISEVYTPGPDIALMSDWPAKIEAMAQRTIDQDVRMVSGMPSWASVLFARVIELAQERGRNVSRMRDIWPNLDLFVHGGVNYAPFKPRIAELVEGDAQADLPHRLELYPASEAFVALQDTEGDRGLRLCADHGNFYEFVPVDEIHSDNPRAFAAWEVVRDVRYVVVLSTCAGLYRYILGDVVEFDTIPGGPDGNGGTGPLRMRIVGRHRLFINAFGENLIVEHIENAVAKAAQALGVRVGEFTAAPIYPSETTRAGLELAIEAELDADRAKKFRDLVDEAIKEQNVDYTTKRTDNLGMTEPKITVLREGAFHAWLDSRGKLGGQHKCPRCANHREFIEGVIASNPA